MAHRPHEYKGKDITVRFDLKRCIHVAECVLGLPGVFDTAKRPWVQPDNATAQEVADVVMRCPTGALHFERTDGGPQEPVPARNTLRCEADGPAYLQGDLGFSTAPAAGTPAAAPVRETRAALCRCGASKNTPFCDQSHEEAGFSDPGILCPAGLRPVAGAEPKGAVRIEPKPNGPVFIQGPIELLEPDGTSRGVMARMALCRCGASAKKPFCDGSHAKAGFKAP